MEFRLQAVGRDERRTAGFLSDCEAGNTPPAKAGTPYVWSSAFRRWDVASAGPLDSYLTVKRATPGLKPELRTVITRNDTRFGGGKLTKGRRCVRLGAFYHPTRVSTVQVRKAIITAAGKAQRTLPLQTVVDRDGIQKTALRIIIEEILDAGVEEIGVVVCPGDQSAYASAAGNHARRIEFFEQSAPLGYGHAVWCVNSFTADQPFLLLVGDHLYV